MNNELQEHKTSDKIKWALTLIAFIVIGVMLIGIICGMLAKKDKPAEKEESEVVVTLPETSGNGVKLTKTLLTAAQYREYGISPQAESAFTITATVQDEFGHSPEHIQRVTYSMGWASSNQENVNDYVTMSVNGTSATLECLKGFSTKINVACTSDIDKTKSATATLDYARRVTGVVVEVNGKQTAVNEGGAVDLALASFGAIGTPEWEQEICKVFCGMVYSSVGTVDDAATSSPNFSFEFTDGFKAALNRVKPAQLSINTHSCHNYPITQKDLLVNLLDLSYSTATGYGNWYYVMQALAETTNQIKVSVSQAHRYTGSGARVNFYLNCKVPATKIAGVNMDSANHTY